MTEQRATERHIDVGDIPKPKAEQYLRDVMATKHDDLLLNDTITKAQQWLDWEQK